MHTCDPSMGRWWWGKCAKREGGEGGEGKPNPRPTWDTHSLGYTVRQSLQHPLRKPQRPQTSHSLTPYTKSNNTNSVVV